MRWVGYFRGLRSSYSLNSRGRGKSAKRTSISRYPPLRYTVRIWEIYMLITSVDITFSWSQLKTRWWFRGRHGSEWTRLNSFWTTSNYLRANASSATTGSTSDQAEVITCSRSGFMGKIWGRATSRAYSTSSTWQGPRDGLACRLQCLRRAQLRHRSTWQLRRPSQRSPSSSKQPNATSTLLSTSSSSWSKSRSASTSRWRRSGAFSWCLQTGRPPTNRSRPIASPNWRGFCKTRWVTRTRRSWSWTCALALITSSRPRSLSTSLPRPC